MIARRVSSILQLVVLCAVPLFVFGLRAQGLQNLVPPSVATVQNGSFVASVNRHIRENMPLRTELQQLAIELQYRSGVVEQNGVFITPDLLLENLEGPDALMVQDNRWGIEDFVQKTRKPTYLMLIPTAVAIKQQAVPDFAAATLFNQKQFIEEVYDEFSGTVSAVEVYSTLFAAKDEYTYYKTHRGLTGAGGYYLYTVLGRRLGAGAIKGLDQFSIQYWDNRFYGDLYEQSPYKSVGPDVISLYRFSRYRREYQVVHKSGGEQKVYYTLYPPSAPALGEKTDILLGGQSPIVDIRVSAGNQDSLLVFADDTVTSYLPFLLTHYSRVTVVDLGAVSDKLLATVDPAQYQQILLGYSLDTYIHTNDLAKLRQFTPRERVS